MSDTIQKAKEFGVDVEWAISRRKEYLDQRIVELKNDQQSTLQAFSGNNELNRFLLLDSMKFFDREIKKCNSELSFKNSRNVNRITEGDIERARQFPLESLLPNVRNGKTNCVSGSHTDGHPSMDVRNGFAYCYSCGFHGDAITICMKVDGVDFVTAVKKLNC